MPMTVFVAIPFGSRNVSFRCDFAIARFPCVEVGYFGRTGFVCKILVAYRTMIILFNSVRYASRRYAVYLGRGMIDKV